MTAATLVGRHGAGVQAVGQPCPVADDEAHQHGPGGVGRRDVGGLGDWELGDVAVDPQRAAKALKRRQIDF